MTRHFLVVISLALSLLAGLSWAWSDPAGWSQPQRHRRARPGKFDQTEVSHAFFENLFAHLVGTRPADSRRAAAAAGSTSPTVTDTPAPATGPSGVWSSLISAVTIEDEIKSLKQNIDKTVTTPGSFAGRGHESARLDFTLLALLFAIVDQYDGEVRWQDSAALARDNFARTASNLKAGGSIQVYNEAKKRKQELDDLVRGTRLQGSGAEDVSWGDLADRAPLMEMLETRFEANLKLWVNSSTQFQTQRERIAHEAQLAAVVAKTLLQDGMDDAEDGEYRSFATALLEASSKLAQAAREDDAAAAGAALTAVSRSCVDCHDVYR